MKQLLPIIALLCFSNCHAQNYLVNFKGTGESSVVNTVKVENLTTGEIRNLAGTDILQLTLPTGVNDTYDNVGSGIKIYPNPMTENSTLRFFPPAGGNAVFTIYDISGKAIFQRGAYLESREQVFRLSDLPKGLYIANIKGDGFSLAGKVFCNGNPKGSINITQIADPDKIFEKHPQSDDVKGIQVTITMPYNTGQYLKFTGTSGEFSTILTSTFSSDKEMTFKFVRCKDGENTNYTVVEIGTQVWMASNLRTTKYNNGDQIGTTTPQTLNITSETNPKYEWIYYGYQLVIDPVIYGRLYTWHAATDTRNICPVGWHLPSRTEWNTLLTAMGGASVAGGKLKETGLSHWSTPNEGATNISGFTGIPTGNRAAAGSCSNYTNVSSLWSSTERDNTYAWYCAFGWNFEGAYTDVNTGKNIGLGIRCVKDQ